MDKSRPVLADAHKSAKTEETLIVYFRFGVGHPYFQKRKFSWYFRWLYIVAREICLLHFGNFLFHDVVFPDFCTHTFDFLWESGTV